MFKQEKNLLEELTRDKDVLFFLIVTLLSIMVRISGREMITGDFYAFLTWYDTLKASGLNPSFAIDTYKEAKNAEEEFQTILAKYFRNITSVRLDSPLCFDSPEELLERAQKLFPQAGDYLQSNQNKLMTYFQTLFKDDNRVILNSDRLFWHCYK